MITLARTQIGVCNTCDACLPEYKCVGRRHCFIKDQKINLTYGSCPACTHAEWCAKHKRCADEFEEPSHG